MRIECFLAALVLAPVAVAFAADPPADKPNILMIMTDDMGYADIGVHGCQDTPTPHIDSLAKRGVRFTDAYANGSFCTPTRAALVRATGSTSTRPKAASSPARTSSPRGDMLFNLADDISEQHDLAATQPEKLAELKKLYEAWSADVDADCRKLGIEPKMNDLSLKPAAKKPGK